MSAKVLKRRLDRRLCDDGLVGDIKAALALIMEGKVLVDDKPISSAGFMVRDDSSVRLKAGKDWVSRGAYKLLTAVKSFGLNFTGRICLDVGSSTGGFTQVMLRGGAVKVYSLDVGYGLLDWSLRKDPRVAVMERQNARFMTKDMFAPIPDFASSDASFISLKLLLGPMANVTSTNAEAVVLVKPQFEAKHEDICEGGVVRDPEVQMKVLDELLKFIAENTQWNVIGVAWSGIKGTKGNIEYLLHLKKGISPIDVDVAKLVLDSHLALDHGL